MQLQIEQCDSDLKSWKTSFQELVNHQQLETFKVIMEKNILTVTDQVLRDVETQVSKNTIKFEARLKTIEKLTSENVQFSVFNVSVSPLTLLQTCAQKQNNDSLKIDHILSQLLPGFKASTMTHVNNKIDRLECEKMI